VKRRLLPALLRAEKDDEDLLIYQCLPDSLKSRIAGGQFHVSDPQLPHAEWQNLFEIMPLGVPWTRRNRKLAIRALSKNCHPGVRAEIMEGLGGWGYDPRLTLDFTPT